MASFLSSYQEGHNVGMSVESWGLGETGHIQV